VVGFHYQNTEVREVLVLENFLWEGFEKPSVSRAITFIKWDLE